MTEVESSTQLVEERARNWRLYRPATEYSPVNPDAEVTDAFINSTKMFLHPDNLEQARVVREVERRRIKLHLKVPIEKKYEVLGIIKTNANEGKLQPPMFKVYDDAIETEDNLRSPNDPIASFVFYFHGAAEESPEEVVTRALAFGSQLSPLLSETMEGASIQPLVRFSYGLNSPGGALTLAQGDGDFKNRCFWPRAQIEKVFDASTNNAFFTEDSAKLKALCDATFPKLQ